jgi:aryl-alcohol dehydrogenase-like predicted oxidoreductase
MPDVDPRHPGSSADRPGAGDRVSTVHRRGAREHDPTVDHARSRQQDPTVDGPTVTRRRALQIGVGALAALAPRELASGEGRDPRTSHRGRPGEALERHRQDAVNPGPRRPADAQEPMIHRPIPSSGEEIPVVGLGTWQTFDVGEDTEERTALRDVLRAFVDLGGTVVDSSPMYGSSQEVLGDLATETGLLDDLWVATKVWTRGQQDGREQMEESMAELRRSRIELMQVHNLVDVDVHLDTLEAWKAEGRFRYIGLTTSSDRQYNALEGLMDDGRLDFVQVNYSLGERESAERILPKARDRGIAVMLNRPFAGGRLFRRFADRLLPDWASEIDVTAWSQLFLKYVLSHPAVTVAIPATSDPEHLRENMGGGVGRLPDADLRRRMEALVDR